MTQATINGNTYSDDGTSAKDMLHGGHRTWFLPMVGDVATVAGVVAGQAAQTAIDSAAATNAAGSIRGTSTTSLTVDAGTKTLATQAGKQFGGGDYVTISRTSAPATKMHGTVTSYSGTALVVEVAISFGSGTYTDWTIALSGPQGATGAIGTAGDIGYLAKTGAYTLTAADKAKIIDCSGAFTLSFQACETLGSSWAAWVKNSGEGNIVLDPYSSQTIDEAATYTLYPGVVALVQCDGSQLRTAAKTGQVFARLPIFSEATVGLEAASVLENIDGELVDTGLTGGTAIYVVYDQVEEVFIASIATGDKIATSPDGITWTLRTMPSSAQWYIVPGPGGWFAYTKGGTATAFSDNAGVSWTSRTAVPFMPQYAAILGGRILLVPGNSTTGAYTDDYGTSWSTVTLPNNNGPIGSVGGLFAMISTTQGVYHTSPTAGTGSWTSRSYPDAGISNFRTSSVSGNLIASISNSTLIAPLYQTTDGISWSEIGDFFGGALSIMGPINEVYVVFASVLGACASFHKPGVPTLRSSGWSGAGHANSAFDGASTHVYGGASSGLVMVIDETAYNKTGLFEV